MEDSNSNISTSSSTIDVASNKSSEDPVNNSGKGLEQRFSSNIDSKPSSTSFSDTNVGGLPSNTSFQDSFSTGSSQEGASAFSGSQSMDTSLSGDQSSLDIGVFHTKRKLHGKDKKVCRVCGDKALGYNFNAMTCESCKAFFRRNALKQATPNCMFQGNCSVDIRTRRFCPHCRLKKCFSMGMKKEMILDRTHRRAKLQNAAIKPEPMEQDLVRPISTSETGTEAFRCSAAATGHFAPPYDASYKGPGSSNAQDYYNASGYAGIDASQYASTYGHQSHEGHSSSTYVPVEGSSTLLCKPEPPSPQPGPSSSSRGHSLAYRNLTDEENKLINYLEMNFKTAANTNFETEYPNSITEINDIYNLAVIWAKKFLKYIKTVDDFKQLDMETQITTLKTSIRSCGMTVAAYTFDAEQNCFVLQDIRTSVEEFLRIFGPFREMTERFVDTVQSMQDAFFKDPGLLSIFELVLIFSPAWDDLIQRKRLSDLQNKYLILLKHYLEAKYSFSKGKELFARVMQKFLQVKDVANERKEIIKQIGTDKLAPIAKEFFAVKTDTPKKE